MILDTHILSPVTAGHPSSDRDSVEVTLDIHLLIEYAR